jgi:NADH-quinone oxidoreductase subunit N
MISQFTMIIPEIMLAALAMIMQIFGVFYKNNARSIALSAMFLSLAIIYYLLFFIPDFAIGFSGSFVVSPTIFLYKSFVLGLTLMSLVIYCDMINISQSYFKMEFITLVLLSTVGIFISISACDLVLLFCGLELQSLSGYALAAFNSQESKSSEAGLKYFVLGALVSCLMLLGISFLYGFSGSMTFTDIRIALEGDVNIGLIVGAVLFIAGILFKLSAAPLHIWTPDVYEGAPISAVTYFATAQKIGILVVLINVVDGLIGDYFYISVEIIKIVAILSMIFGAFGAIMQSSLKRLMAYSTILNVGYVLVAVCLNSPEGNETAFIYMLIYAISAIAFFACLVALFGNKSDVATFEDLKGIANQRKSLAGAISIIMFSMIGLPPLAGFFGKYLVFYNAILEGEVLLAVIGVLTSVVAAFYYLKVVKYMYFMQITQEIKPIVTQKGLMLVTSISLAFIMFFFTFASQYIL